jgi:hypothetical protein
MYGVFMPRFLRLPNVDPRFLSRRSVCNFALLSHAFYSFFQRRFRVFIPPLLPFFAYNSVFLFRRFL